ncbi:hypothetical protein BDBG_18060 [Blastomyces gilchristii SLH14081]|uniref:Uncharacterized protein n=1 Tax=Blastomyces gilchristii (strain SLH14081) TaxID=559298 RepID=A0A179V756_BLAGS|nr:uncharacterized protein BDBG_18060 [Blastomyces gilchristii SLH14081]OAT14502.1 hypothetical protein BDBG_18060 [Blastomyces gilchristii SLH14081]
MAYTEAEPRSAIVIDDDTDAETPRSPPRELQRKRCLVNYSLLKVYEDQRSIRRSTVSEEEKY